MSPHVSSQSMLTDLAWQFSAIASISMLSGVLPCYLVRWFNTRGVLRTPRVRAFISAVICFSGGTLLGVTFLHLMPDMREKMESLGWEGPGHALPVSDIVTCCGFFFVYIFDELMHMLIEWYSSRSEHGGHCASHHDSLTTAFSNQTESGVTSMRSEAQGSAEGKAAASVKAGADGGAAAAVVDPCVSTAPMHHEVHIHGCIPQVPSRRLEPRPLGYHEHEHDPHSSSHPIDVPAEVPPFTGLITIVALSFHDIFEGLAIGVESDVRDVAFLFMSIAAHKYAIAFCIGMDLVLSRVRPLPFISYMLTFSIVSPVGIVVGIACMDLGTSFDTPVSPPTGDGAAAGAGGRHAHLRGVLRGAAARGQRHARQGRVQRALRAAGLRHHARPQAADRPLPRDEGLGLTGRLQCAPPLPRRRPPPPAAAAPVPSTDPPASVHASVPAASVPAATVPAAAARPSAGGRRAAPAARWSTPPVCACDLQYSAFENVIYSFVTLMNKAILFIWLLSLHVLETHIIKVNVCNRVHTCTRLCIIIYI